jgi:hypothetical protein
MKINQLFREVVDVETLQALLACFDIRTLGMHAAFCKCDMARMRTAQRVAGMSDALRRFYLPCKASIYLSNVSSKRCVTILRQVLKLHHMRLISLERYHGRRKCCHYYVAGDGCDGDGARWAEATIHITHAAPNNQVTFE